MIIATKCLKAWANPAAHTPRAPLSIGERIRAVLRSRAFLRATGVLLLLFAVLHYVVSGIICFVEAGVVGDAVEVGGRLSSMPPEVAWSDWLSPTGTVYAANEDRFKGYVPLAYRYGVKRDWIGTWTVYEIRLRGPEGEDKVTTAWGPTFLRSPQRWVSLVAFVSGVIVLVASRFVRGPDTTLVGLGKTMTIREYLKRERRPYRIDQGVCALVAALSFTLWFHFEWQDPLGRPPYLVITIGTMATIALFVAAILPLFRIRCPKCNGCIGPPRRKWKHCPYCGAELDADLQDGYRRL